MADTFDLDVVQVFEDKFLYKRGNQRDKWFCYYNEALPIGLKVKLGEKYHGTNIIKTINGEFKSWQIEFNKIS